jgi:hypothetical protein
MTRAVIYTRPTYHITGDAQFRAILDTFSCEWDNPPNAKRYAEKRLEMRRFEQMLAKLGEGDCVYVYNPAIFGIGVEQAVENMRRVLERGARIVSMLYGEITQERADHIAIAGEIVRECCSIEQGQEYLRNKGLKQEIGGYFENGVWHEGQRKSYAPPHWAYHKSQHKVDVHLERRESPAVRWIDMKIMEAWTTERIWAEYKDLCKVMPDDVWDKYSKQWINKRRLELIK